MILDLLLLETNADQHGTQTCSSYDYTVKCATRKHERLQTRVSTMSCVTIRKVTHLHDLYK